MQNSTHMRAKILFIIPYPLKESPSQRFRFEQYFELLTRAGYHYEVQSFLDSQNWQVFFKPGKIFQKLLALLKGSAKRLLALLKSPMYDFIFIHREAAPIGPPLYEWFAGRVFRKKIIYDFDDAIWKTDRVTESVLTKILKCRSKVGGICKWSYKVSCGNEYLREYALQFNRNSVVNPTTIDTLNLHNPALHSYDNQEDKVTIGWTGSHSTLKYLSEIENVLTKILDRYQHVQFTIIADKKPQLNVPFTFIKWSLASEISDLMRFDIGVMPLPNDEWSKGKCGFKILQYMALRIPAVASPVGVNAQIIIEGETGFLCTTESEWIDRLSQLIKDAALRARLGVAGRQRVIEHYSVHSNSSNFLRLFT